MDSDKKSMFQEAMKGVKPLRASKQQQTSKPPKPARTRAPIKHKHEHDIPRPAQTLSNPLDTSNIQANTCLSYGKSHVQAKQFKALKQGEWPIEARLDLHGFSLDNASDTLTHFISRAALDGLRLVLIIHGKGGRFHEPPLIKTHVNHWLKQLPEVLAFHSARPHHGGEGALYVLLRR